MNGKPEKRMKLPVCFIPHSMLCLALFDSLIHRAYMPGTFFAQLKDLVSNGFGK